MESLSLGDTCQAPLASSVVAIMFVSFPRESLPTEVVAILGVAVRLVTGLLANAAALEVLSNPAPWTIAAMFLVMGALVRTNSLVAFTKLADRAARYSPLWV